MYTTSSAFLQTLANAGITHAFVNWGSDHPALLEDLERQRVEGGGSTKPAIVTCPSEMVALSAAQGYAQVTGRPAAVIIHVDVGTQCLAGAIHNVDRGQTPVLIYAGASPFTTEGELKGSRNEFITWIQDIPDQSAIVRQYMRCTTEIHSGKNVSRVVKRSLQMALSEPKGPVYLWARREVMEEEVDASVMEAVSDLRKWPAVEPCALSPTAAAQIADALVSSQRPLIITSNLGRNKDAVAHLVALSEALAIPVVTSCPTAVCMPASHPHFAGVTYLAKGTHAADLADADVVLIIDTDVPLIPLNDRPREDARVFVLSGGDPLKRTYGEWHVDAELVCLADAALALSQILQAVPEKGEVARDSTTIAARGELLASRHSSMVAALDAAEDSFTAGVVTVPNILGVLRRTIEACTPSRGRNALILNECASYYPTVWQHMRPDVPGSFITSGGSSLGWGLGAAVGAVLGSSVASAGAEHDLTVAIVGDGAYLFGVPGSAYWIARNQNTPFLTIILNNGGWRSPKLSMERVHPEGHGIKAGGDRLSVGFGPVSPDYSQIAVAASAGWAWGRRVGDGDTSTKAALEATIMEAIKVVVEERRCAVVDCVTEKF